MELLATRNFMMPRFDVVGAYRYRGFGDSLLDPQRDGQFSNAYQDLTTGNFQEWRAGLEFAMTFGFRQASAAVRNAELHLARERAILKAMEQEVLYDLAQAVAEMDRGFVVLQTNYNRMIAAREQVAAVQAAFEDDRIQFIAVLDAQRRLAEDEAQYYRSRTEYGVGLKNVHFEKGTLLDYLGVATSEGQPWLLLATARPRSDRERRQHDGHRKPIPGAGYVAGRRAAAARKLRSGTRTGADAVAHDQQWAGHECHSALDDRSGWAKLPASGQPLCSAQCGGIRGHNSRRHDPLASDCGRLAYQLYRLGNWNGDLSSRLASAYAVA
jgi:hypothetical protein